MSKKMCNFVAAETIKKMMSIQQQNFPMISGYRFISEVQKTQYEHL